MRLEWRFYDGGGAEMTVRYPFGRGVTFDSPSMQREDANADDIDITATESTTTMNDVEDATKIGDSPHLKA